jgi:hypothetical protein
MLCHPCLEVLLGVTNVVFPSVFAFHFVDYKGVPTDAISMPPMGASQYYEILLFATVCLY